MSLAGKVVMVTGGTSGIGRAVAVRAAGLGARVVVCGRHEQRGRAVVAEITEAGADAVFAAGDVTVDADVARLVRVALDRYGALHGAVNNAGDVLAPGGVPEVDPARWDAEILVNLTSVYLGLRHQLPAIRASGGGSIVTNASIAGCTGVPGLAAYTAAKHGVVGLTRAAALENAEHGVRVNTLVTGNVDTPLYRRLLGVAPDDPEPLPAPNPSRRVATPAEVAALVTFLLADESAFITGAALPIDGGQTAQ